MITKRNINISIIVIIGLLFVFLIFYSDGPERALPPQGVPHPPKKPTTTAISDCTLADVQTYFDISPNVSGWNTFTDQDLSIQFQYPPSWKVLKSGGLLTVVPPYSAEREYGDDRGYNIDWQFGITITTPNDSNGLGSMTQVDVLNGLPRLKFPLQQRWFRASHTSSLVVYCIFDYSQGISALIPMMNDGILEIAITRFAVGYNRPEDWDTFFGILWTLKLKSPIRLESRKLR